MLKKIIQNLVREDYWSYLSWYKDRFGYFSAVFSLIKAIIRGIATAPNLLTGSIVYLRPGTTDQSVYDSIFLSKEYDLNLGNPLFIVDAGAHIGLSSVFFASKYPESTVVAIEPEPSNFDILRKNAEKFKNIKIIQAGLWSRKTTLRIENTNAATWSFKVIEDQSGKGIQAIGVRDVMSQFNMDRIDVLKIDIEGSEVEVLSSSGSWIDSIRTMIIELHDRYKPGCTEALQKAVFGYDYNREISGESVVLSNIRKISLKKDKNN